MRGSRVLSSKISLRVSGLWEARHVFLEAQSCPADHVQLLGLSAQRGQVWRSLLQMGYRLSRVPGPRSVEMIELLIQYVFKFEASQVQKFAIEKRNAQLLNYLLRAWVNLVPANELGESAIHIIKNVTLTCSMSSSLLTVLTRGFLSVGPEMYRERHMLLQIACRTARSEAIIDYLLERGANLYYFSATENNALTALEQRLKSQMVKWDTQWKLLQLIQLPENHVPKQEGKMQVRDHCGIKTRGLDTGTGHKYWETDLASATTASSNSYQWRG